MEQHNSHVDRPYRTGHSDRDWAGRDELNRLYLNRAAIGGFLTRVYWSSTESGATGACSQWFNDGFQDSQNKANGSAVRAVRSF